MRPIKKRTYYNMMRVIRMIQAKGYDSDLAHSLAHRTFTQYEENPHGLPILSLVDMIIPADEYNAIYKEATQ